MRRAAQAGWVAGACLLPALLAAAGAAEEPSRGMVVALDVGHSIASPGAMSARGKGEFHFNRRIARLAAGALAAAGFQPVIINERGATLALAERPARALAAGAFLMVSIHHDYVNDRYLRKWDFGGKELPYSDKFRGYSVFCSGKSPRLEESAQLAMELGRAMRAAGFQPTLHHAEPIRGEGRPLLDKDNGVYQFDDLVVLKYAKIPAALIECGVLAHRDEELDLERPETQARIADAIAKAVVRFVAGGRAADAAAPGVRP